MTNELTVEALRNLVNVSAKIREDSWNGEFMKYDITIGQACVQACSTQSINKEFASIVEFALHGSWNNILAWAKQ